MAASWARWKAAASQRRCCASGWGNSPCRRRSRKPCWGSDKYDLKGNRVMEPIWLENYPAGIPADITDEAARYDSLVALFEESCGQHAGKPAYLSMGAAMTYAQLDERSRHFAARSEEHTSELQSLMRISYAVFCLKKQNITHTHDIN